MARKRKEGELKKKSYSKERKLSHKVSKAGSSSGVSLLKGTASDPRDFFGAQASGETKIK